MESFNSFFLECFVHLKTPRDKRIKLKFSPVLVQLHKMAEGIKTVNI